MDRRNFLKFLGITSGTAMVASCGVDKANEKLIPWVIPPEEEVYPGKPLYYNTTCSECPANCGMQVRVNEKVYHEMRGLFPTKLEGIENHPINDGALCVRGQAGLFRLYHPERIKRPLMRDEQGKLRVTTWREAYTRILGELDKSTAQGKSNVYFSGRTTGTLSEVIDRFTENMNVERLPEYEVYAHSNIREANRIVFNRAEVPHYRIENADLLLTFGADLFETFVSPVSYAAQFGRAIKQNELTWFHLEPHISLTGVQATNRISIRPQSEAFVLAFLIKAVVKQNVQSKQLSADVLETIPNYSAEEVSRQTGLSVKNLRVIAAHFAGAQNPLVISGGASTAHFRGLEVALLTALLQWSLGMTDQTVDFSRSENYASVGNMLDVREFINRLKNQELGVVFIAKTDPEATLPPASEFSANLERAGLRVGLADYMTETVKQCDIILPLSHSLESWGDATPRRGLRTVFQPAIEPQFDTRSEGDILLQLMQMKSDNQKTQTYKDYLFEKWNQLYGEAETQQLLKRGYREQAVSPVEVEIDRTAVSAFMKNARFMPVPQKPVLMITPSIRTYDGRSNMLPLLYEIPDPLTTITYDNWISVPGRTAKVSAISDGDEVMITVSDREWKMPVKVQAALQQNVYVVQRDLIQVPDTEIDDRSGEMSWFVEEISVAATGTRIPLPILAGSMHEENRGLLPPEEEHGEEEHVPVESDMYPEHEHLNYRWGMVIDLESCIGCSACSAACYVENNLPIVGKEEHLKGREMSWIRMEPFYRDDEFVEFVPMLCQQCDNAPCEPVCPVYAAYHNQEGLNVQVYNRCVGTRYCSNNCPYKVRRFNWFDWRLPEPWDKMHNPTVSVRTRGIMEKCMFCVQRIRQAKDHAKDQGRLVRDGEVIPACAQTCPTNAITFGNLKDHTSRVSQLARSERAYRALEELGTEPAVHYLARKESKEKV